MNGFDIQPGMRMTSNAFSPAVNGKMPIAAWIPSRDDAGNGTTTLTDLVGSNNGTLTNMDPATDRVADTDAGGVRALDFDGVNDYVDCGNTAEFKFGLDDPFSISVWASVLLDGTDQVITGSGYLLPGYHLRVTSANRARFIILQSGTRYKFADSAVLSAGWNHFIATWDGTNPTLYTNGVSSTASGSEGVLVNITSSNNLEIGRVPVSGKYANMKLDDIRIFDQALDATDVAALYASGLGRGVHAS